MIANNIARFHIPFIIALLDWDGEKAFRMRCVVPWQAGLRGGREGVILSDTAFRSKNCTSVLFTLYGTLLNHSFADFL